MAVVDERTIFSIERPSGKLLTYYVLCCLATGPLFPIFILPYYFRYHTMRFRFDREGVSMRWGLLFRKEIILNYSRIQDIHVSSNVIERWLGLARLQIQTASGSAGAEMTIEGIEEFESVRDFLYSRMRGQKEQQSRGVSVAETPGITLSAAAVDELTAALKQTADELKGVRLLLSSQAGGEVFKPGDERTKSAVEPLPE